MRLSQLVVAVRKSIGGVGNDALLTRAAAIAFYSALSFAPLIVLLLWLLAALRPEWQQQLIEGLAGILGEKAAGAIDLVMQNAKSTPELGNLAGIIGALITLFSVSVVFAQLQRALNVIWDVRAKPGKAVTAWLWARARHRPAGGHPVPAHRVVRGEYADPHFRASRHRGLEHRRAAHLPARVHRRVRRHVPPAAGRAHCLVGRLARRSADHGVVRRRQIRAARKWPRLQDVTGGFVYMRLHGDKVLYASGYTDAALDDWAARIRAWMGGGQPGDAKDRVSADAPPPRKSRDVYCYFDNDIKVKAPFDAMKLCARFRR